MGGGGSSSTKETVNKTVNKTLTKTSVGDIGLTGDAAVALADILQSGALQSEALRVQSLGTVADTLSGSLQGITEAARAQAQTSAALVSNLAARSVGADAEPVSGKEAGENLVLVFGGIAALVTILLLRN